MPHFFRMPKQGRLQMYNGWPKGVTVTSKMENFEIHFPPSLEVPTATPTPASPAILSPIIRTPSTWELFKFSAVGKPWWKSWIEFSVKDSSIKFDFGDSGFKVDHIESPLGQAMGVVAPTIPEEAGGSGYSLSVFTGPGNLGKTLDSIIQANRDSIMSSVQEQLRNSTDLIKGIKTDYFGCSFASVSKQGRNSSWNMDLILKFSGTITLKPPLLVISDAGIPDLAVQLSCTIDTTNSSEDVKQVPQIHVNRIQLSLGKIDSYLDTFNSITNYLRIPSWNSTENKALLEDINARLNDSLLKLGDLAKLEALEPYNLSTIPQTPPSQSNHETWMSTSAIQRKRLGQLKIPGTHNSAAYKFGRFISPILEGALGKLRNLRTGTAASDHRLDNTEDIYIGQQAYNDLIDHIALLSQAHDESKTLERQLEDGIRFLDLRIYREDDGEYYNQHFLRGSKLDELLDQIGQFLGEHSSSAEFIIVEIAQCNSLREHVTEVANKVESRLGRWLYMPSDAETNPGRYDFQTLHDKTLSSITEGEPKVLFVSREGACNFPHSVLNVDDNSLEKPGEGSPLLPKWFTKVPTNGEEVAHILLNTFDPDARIKNLRHRAYERNAEVSQVLSQKDTPWRYMMDWYTDCKGVEKSEDLPVERIIRANK